MTNSTRSERWVDLHAECETKICTYYMEEGHSSYERYSDTLPDIVATHVVYERCIHDDNEYKKVFTDVSSQPNFDRIVMSDEFYDRCKYILDQIDTKPIVLRSELRMLVELAML